MVKRLWALDGDTRFIGLATRPLPSSFASPFSSRAHVAWPLPYRRQSISQFSASFATSEIVSMVGRPMKPRQVRTSLSRPFTFSDSFSYASSSSGDTPAVAVNTTGSQ